METCRRRAHPARPLVRAGFELRGVDDSISLLKHRFQLADVK